MSDTPLRCRLFGHSWSLDPPWTGKELQYEPNCERCGKRPSIVVTGGPTNDHRV